MVYKIIVAISKHKGDEYVKLNKNDYLEKDATFWEDFRKKLYQSISDQEQEEKIEKTPKNIVMLAQQRGVKPTARYFNIEPSQVRYYIKKLEKEKEN